MPQNIYDNPEFFAGYDAMREANTGINEVIEQPAIRSLLPDVRGLRVLDMGCGAGEMCRYLIEQGAASVIGMDVSERMLEKAKSYDDTGITYIHTAAEEASFEPGSFNLVVSSFLLHYIKDISPVIKNIHGWLSPGGKYVFSMEHPIATSSQGLFGDTWSSWLKDDDGKVLAWKVANYSDEGERISRWFVDGVVKYHRTMATIINTLADSGFRINRMLEPHASEQAEQERPELIDERLRPLILFVAAQKGESGG